MSPEERELLDAATDRHVHLTKTGDDSWEVGMMPDLGLLTNDNERQAEALLSGGGFRLPDGREFKRVMTTAEARAAFGLGPIHGAEDDGTDQRMKGGGQDEPSRLTIIQRPFNWGLVIVVGDDWDGERELPAFEQQRMVGASEFAVTIGVRHAQDSEEFETGDDGEEYLKLAETRVEVRLLDSPPADAGRREVFSGLVAVPSGRLSIGDADEETIVAAHPGNNRIVVSVDHDVGAGDLMPDAVYVDLLPA